MKILRTASLGFLYTGSYKEKSVNNTLKYVCFEKQSYPKITTLVLCLNLKITVGRISE